RQSPDKTKCDESKGPDISITLDEDIQGLEWKLPLNSINTKIYDVCYQMTHAAITEDTKFYFQAELHSSRTQLSLVGQHFLLEKSNSENKPLVNLCIGDLANLDPIEYSGSELVVRIKPENSKDLTKDWNKLLKIIYWNKNRNSAKGFIADSDLGLKAIPANLIDSKPARTLSNKIMQRDITIVKKMNINNEITLYSDWFENQIDMFDSVEDFAENNTFDWLGQDSNFDWTIQVCRPRALDSEFEYCSNRLVQSDSISLGRALKELSIYNQPVQLVFK